MIRKVSVITPCYNGEKYIHRLLDSVLEQTYSHIEMCVIDDGSTDNSASIIKSYVSRFESKGYSLTYMHQKNSGQSAAINKGLQWMSGDYLVWPDSDDFYASSQAIEKLVHVLDNSGHAVSMVRCHSTLLDENTLEQVGELRLDERNTNKVELFEDCLFSQNGFWFVPGNYMAKVETLRSVLPSLTIYSEKNAGQNWQLMLPLFYRHECLTLPESLYSIVVRAKSHSRGQYSTYEQSMAKYGSYERSIINTLLNIDMESSRKSDYITRIENKYLLVRLETTIEYGRCSEATTILAKLDESNVHVPLKHRIKYQASRVSILNKLLCMLIRIRRHVFGHHSQ